MYSDVKKVLFDKETVRKRVEEMGRELSEIYRGEPLVMVCTLRGACIFYADLIRAMDMPMELDFLQASSYGDGTETSGVVKINKDISTDIKGKNVVIVEDITDSGVTMNALLKVFATRGAKSLKVCTLLDKPARRKVDFVPDYIGFTIPDEFIIGYGLDYAQKYRNIPEVCVFDTSKM